MRVYFHLFLGLAFADADLSPSSVPDVFIRSPGVFRCGPSVVTLANIQEGIAHLVRDISSAIDKLKLGLPITVNTALIRDDLSETRPGFMFGYNGPEKLNYSHALLMFIMSSEKLRDKYCTRKGFVEHSVVKWLTKYDNLERKILLLIHLLSGLPARGTELATYKLRNGPSCLRSVYVEDGRIFFMPIYNKTRNVSRKNKFIVRFMDSRSSQLILEDIILLRPLAAAFNRSLDRNVNNIYESEFFVLSGRVMTDEKIRETFSEQFNRYCKSPLLFSSYRQLSAALAWECHIIPHEDLNEEEIDDEADDDRNSYIAMQFGHEHKMSMKRYGRTNKVCHRHAFLLFCWERASLVSFLLELILLRNTQ
jgi:hypothetical protein